MRFIVITKVKAEYSKSTIKALQQCVKFFSNFAIQQKTIIIRSEIIAFLFGSLKVFNLSATTKNLEKNYIPANISTLD